MSGGNTKMRGESEEGEGKTKIQERGEEMKRGVNEGYEGRKR